MEDNRLHKRVLVHCIGRWPVTNILQEPATSLFREGSDLNINLSFNISNTNFIITLLPVPVFLATKIRRRFPCGWLHKLLCEALERVTDRSSKHNADIIEQLLTTY